MLVGLALEHEMGRIGTLWDMGKDERDRWEAQEEKKKELLKSDSSQTTKDDMSKGKDSTSIPSNSL